MSSKGAPAAGGSAIGSNSGVTAAGASIPAVSSSSASSRLSRNGPRNKSDVAWNHGVSIEGTRKIQCKYCQKVYTGGAYRLKHHLAGTNKDAEPCRAVPDHVKKEMFNIVTDLQQKLIQRSSTIEESIEIGDKRRKTNEIEVIDVERDGNIFRKMGVSSQTTLSNIFKKNVREEACQATARFFYNNAIPFNMVRSEEFPIMCDLIAKHGPGYKPPSYHELQVKYLKLEVELTKQILEEHKAEWRKVGCTIMTDVCTDKRRRRTLLNFLVNSPKGTVFLKSIDASHIEKTADRIFKMLDDVVEEVGEENVVQVVTNNAENYKAAGEMLMAKRKNLYWTPCAAHCIDLMLEDFEKKIPIHKETILKGRKIITYIYSRTSLITLLQHFTKGKDLARPDITRFATSYLTLEWLHEHKGGLIRMLTSKDWKSSNLARTKDGRLVEHVVLDKQFWNDVLTCSKAAFPLMRVLRMVDSHEKPAMGFIYESMDQAKENIEKAFNGVKKSYEPIWKIIDDRWDNQLHRPLHAAGYFLNPQLHYSPEFQVDLEVKQGLYDCLYRLVVDENDQVKIDVSFDAFKKRAGLFGTPLARMTIDKKTPTNWWDSHGDEHPELQKFATRILSLTCSSSGCERNWSAFETVHTKRRNRPKQKTMNDVVFVITNSKLAKKKQARRGKDLELNLDDVAS